MRFAFSRRQVISLFGVVFVLVGSFVYTLTRQSNAQVADIIDIDKYLVARPTGAGACPPETITAFSCSAFLSLDNSQPAATIIARTISGQVKSLVTTAESLCLPKDPSRLKVSATYKAESARCTVTEMKGNPVAREPINLKIDIALPIPGTLYSKDYTRQEFHSQGKEAISAVGNATAQISPSYVFNPDKKNWTLLFNSESTVLRNIDIDGPVVFDMFSVEALPKPEYDNKTIHLSSLERSLETSGRVNGYFSLHKTPEDSEAKITRLDFCPIKCTVTTIINYLVEGEGTDIQKFKGPFKIAAYQKETYSGTGTGEAATGKLHWNQDLNVNKISKRELSYAIEIQSNKAKRSTNYSETRKSTATIFPFNQQDSLVKSDINKKVTFNADVPIEDTLSLNIFGLNRAKAADNKIANHEVTSSKNSGEASITIKEVGKLVNGGNSITKTGSGSVTLNDARGTVTYSGPVDSEHCPLKSEEIFVTKGEAHLNQCLDPFSNPHRLGLGDDIPLVSAMRNTPGYFRAGKFFDSVQTVITANRIKTLPKKIIVFNSFSKDEAYIKSDLLWKILEFIDQLKRSGVDIQLIDTDSQEKFLTALRGLSRDTALINLGHGWPDGLYVGKDFVTYAQISLILHSKQVKLNSFNPFSCYSASTSPIAETISGSVGVGFNLDTGEDALGSVFGIGTNRFHITINDIIDALESITGEKCEAK